MRNKEQNINSADYMNAAYTRMLPAWEITGDLWGGTLDIRDKTTKYLPQFNKEPKQKYNQRLESSVFFNNFQTTIAKYVGLVFKNNIVPEEAPAIIKEMFTDIDLCGNDIEMFLRGAFTTAIRDGHSFIFVDAPPMMDETADAPPTLADVADRRAYWVAYEAHQAANWQFEIIGGRNTLSQVTFASVSVEPVGKYGEAEIIKYKTVRRGADSVGGTYEEFYYNDKKELVSEGIKQASWQEIPLAVVYGRKLRPMESRPPLLELALLNILHYQKTSDFDDICHRLCVPILTRKLGTLEDLKALNEVEKGLTISPAVMMNIFGENADLKYTEVSGAGLEIVSNRIKEIESQMAKLGLEMLAPTDIQTAKTATEVVSDNTQSQSELAVMAKNLETAVEQAFYFTAEMTNAIKGAGTISLGEAEKSKLKLKIDYNRLTFSIQQLQFIANEVKEGRLSHETYLEFLFNYTEMPKGLTVEMEKARLKSEQANAPDPVKEKETPMIKQPPMMETVQ